MPHILGLTNALTDIVIKVAEQDITNLGIKKGSTNGFSKIDTQLLDKIISKRKQIYQTGGSPANVIFNSHRLGLTTALMGTVGNDEIGSNYIKELEKTDIFYVFNKSKGESGRVYVLTTPDGERTQVADIGVAGRFDFSTNPVPFDNDIFYTSGYEIESNPSRVMELIEELADETHTMLAFDLSCEKVIKSSRGPIEKIVRKTGILFATEEEASELTGLDPDKALEELSGTIQTIILKRGKKGSTIKARGKRYDIPAYPAKIANTCGAGDAYASGFLFGHLKGFSLEESGRFASYIASRVCARKESHL